MPKLSVLYRTLRGAPVVSVCILGLLSRIEDHRFQDRFESTQNRSRLVIHYERVSGIRGDLQWLADLRVHLATSELLYNYRQQLIFQEEGWRIHTLLVTT